MQATSQQDRNAQEDYQFSAKIMIRKESMSWLIKRLNLSSYEANHRIASSRTRT